MAAVQAATDVVLVVGVPAGTQFVSASDGGTEADRASERAIVHCRCRAGVAGQGKFVVEDKNVGTQLSAGP